MYIQYLIILIMATISVPHINSLRGYIEWLKTNTLGFATQAEISVKFKEHIFTGISLAFIIGFPRHVGVIYVHNWIAKFNFITST